MSNNSTRNLKCFLGFLALTSVAALTPVTEAKPLYQSQTLLERSGLSIESSTIKPQERTLSPSLESLKPNGDLKKDNFGCNGNCDGEFGRQPSRILTNHATPINRSIRQIQR